ncbi:2'3' and 3'5' cyclic nucleotide monophosphates phosphodiesterase involved in biofilm formation [Candidatus Hydrogenisulfobacillus filiaventi]|uniref:2'3' and 3'5' cyclic nucleotide monophosphates phosphodiesterase involved in biofilm formation n=1 Tax=Candidatus Hydrogenisulfobacillus filiaventi TaxID=2707344 RepID=A0A6F8ZGG4_9FIRM|nr:TIGR00282 family metallophosphoesterase [Bacillota bacterium]CAB1128870.1 2'3' and 3'5' cyclic nucleotide monophosphates phosphodiesterase involved in biofilm formation [Candidatus Hydrogenisulfobacillus filiaventi]
MRLLMVGDVVGRVGRRMLAAELTRLRASAAPDLVVVNGENAAGGNGITHEILDEILAQGVQVVTSGNHIFDKREVLTFLDEVPQLLRPLNLPPGTPGHGYVVTAAGGVPAAVINLAGRAFMPVQYDDPFRAVDAVLASLPEEVRVVVVDFHAETTSEKVAMGWYLDGRVSVVAGTHTHVQTADARILPGGTAYLTDLGMTGPAFSVIGVRTELVLQKLTTQLPVRFETAGGPGVFSGLLVDINPADGRAYHIERLLRWEEAAGGDQEGHGWEHA